MFGVRPGLGTHPHADQTNHRSGGSLSGQLNPRCRVVGIQSAGSPPQLRNPFDAFASVLQGNRGGPHPFRSRH